jgi:Immunoglobulin I-set domain
VGANAPTSPRLVAFNTRKVPPRSLTLPLGLQSTQHRRVCLKNNLYALLQNDPDVRVDRIQAKSCRLVIHNVRRSHGGRYTCSARNDVGNDNKTMELIVECLLLYCCCCIQDACLENYSRRVVLKNISIRKFMICLLLTICGFRSSDVTAS